MNNDQTYYALSSLKFNGQEYRRGDEVVMNPVAAEALLRDGVLTTERPADAVEATTSETGELEAGETGEGQPGDEQTSQDDPKEQAPADGGDGSDGTVGREVREDAQGPETTDQ